MRNFFQKYHTRILIFSLALLFLVIVVVVISVNISLAQYKEKIESDASAGIGQRVSIEKISYSFPYSIVLRKISVFDDSDTTEDVVFIAEKVIIKLSLIRLLQRETLFVKAVYIDGLETVYPAAVSFLRKNIKNIISTIASLPKKGKLNISFRKTLVYYAQPKSDSDYVMLDIGLKLDDEHFLSRGSIDIEHSFLKKTNMINFTPFKRPLRYVFSGYLTKKGVAIENFELKHKKLDSKLWGALEDGVLRLNGFSTLHEFFPLQSVQGSSRNLRQRISDFLRRFRFSNAIIGPSLSDLTIYDISCLIRFYFPKIDIEDISFSFQNIPISLSGDLSFLDPTVVDLKISSFPQQQSKIRLRNPKRYDIGIRGLLKKKGFSGTVDVEFVRPGKNVRSSDKITAVLKHAVISPLENWRFKLLIEAAKMIYEVTAHDYNLFFDDTVILIDLKDTRFKNLVFKSGIYDGSLEGEGYFDVGVYPPKMVFDFSLNEITPKKLESLLEYFSNIEGKFQAQLHYQNQPIHKISGQMVVRNGYLYDFDFFNWLADFFAIPSLAKIDFDEFSADFAVDDEVSRLENIYLDYKGVSLQGYYRLFANDLVSSKLSLGISRKILETSPKFKSLLNPLGKEFSALDFSFQLSGLYTDLNFKWLDSDFKERLKERIPDFIERGIERKIKAITESAPEG